MKHRKNQRLLLGIVASAISGLSLVSCTSNNQPTMPPDDPDMALRLAQLDGVEASEAGEYVALMDELNQLCMENRAMIGGYSKGIADVWLKQYDQEMTMLEGMESLLAGAEIQGQGESVFCLEVFTEFRRAHGDIE